jgi:hypothetical protein
MEQQVSEPGIQDLKVADEDKRHRNGKPAGAEQSDLMEKTGLCSEAFARV